MLVRFFKQGSSKSGNTSSKSVKDYLLNERVKNGTARIIRGDEAYTSEQIDLCNYARFTSTYTSGCLSFEKNENLTEQQKQQLMQSFEQALLPEFDKNRYACYWVEHIDKGRLELNFVYAKIDIATGKHLDVYQQRRDVARLNYWKELQIQAYDLSDPNEPHRQRLFNNTQPLNGLMAVALLMSTKKLKKPSTVTYKTTLSLITSIMPRMLKDSLSLSMAI